MKQNNEPYKVVNYSVLILDSQGISFSMKFYA